MADGWENARRRDGGHDYATFCARRAAGLIRQVEIDTSYFVGNAPGWVRLLATDQRRADLTGAGLAGAGPAGLAADDGTWWEVLPRLAVQPDTRHRFLADAARAASHVRLEVFPDGGLARLRVHGELDPPALDAAWQRWRDSLPAQQLQSLPPPAA